MIKNMHTVYAKNFQMENINKVLLNTLFRKENSKINGSTANRLNKIRKDLAKEVEDYMETKKKMIDDLVKGGSKKPKIDKKGNLVFKTKKGEKEFLDFVNSYSPIHLRCLLDDLDLKQIVLSVPEMDVLELITTEGAITENPEKKEESEEAESDIEEEKKEKK